MNTVKANQSKQSKLKYVGVGFATAGAIAFSGVRFSPFHFSESQASSSLSATTSQTQPLENPNIFVALSQKVVPSVVNISTLSTPRRQDSRMNPDEFFRHFFGGEGAGPGGGLNRFPPQAQQESGPRPLALGTGFIVDSSGLILTNNHVIQGADEIRIQFTEEVGEKPVIAKVLGTDPDLDIALLQVKTDRKLIAAPLGDSDSLQVGEYVMAVGNPFGQGHSVTHGIVSAKGRLSPELPLTNYLQTDAPINPGNSGGPLLNLKGEVIGINNAIDARAQNIGFAIPINAVKSVLAQLKSDGKVSRGYLGVQVTPLTEELTKNLGLPQDLKAPMVAQADPGAPAFRAGIRPYDVITHVAGKKIETPAELITAIAAAPAGDSIELKINRGGDEKSFKVKLGSRPNQVAQR